MEEMNYRQAISFSLREEMRRDESVFLIGQDIGIKGGAFYVTRGFLEEFGSERVIDSTLAESNIVGVAIGASLRGLRPVAEMQFSDFVTEAFKMIVDYAAGAHYRGMGSVPITVRLPAGAIKSAGPFHSRNPEAWFFHSPGLKIVNPACPYDAVGLLRAAIRDPNPVLYMEYKKLYNLPLKQIPPELHQEIPEEDFVVPIGRARVLREGSDLSLVTYGTMVYDSLAAARGLEKEGVEVEVIDMRSLLPFDWEAVRRSVERTGKALIVHEDTLTGGVGAEFAARIADDCFELLDGPVRRVAAIDTPIPFSPPLEEFFLPNAEKIAQAARELAAY